MLVELDDLLGMNEGTYVFVPECNLVYPPFLKNSYFSKHMQFIYVISHGFWMKCHPRRFPFSNMQSRLAEQYKRAVWISFAYFCLWHWTDLKRRIDLWRERERRAEYIYTRCSVTRSLCCVELSCLTDPLTCRRDDGSKGSGCFVVTTPEF